MGRVQVFGANSLSSALGAGAAQAHLRSKEALLELLHTRVLDKVTAVRVCEWDGGVAAWAKESWAGQGRACAYVHASCPCHTAGHS